MPLSRFARITDLQPRIVLCHLLSGLPCSLDMLAVGIIFRGRSSRIEVFVVVVSAVKIRSPRRSMVARFLGHCVSIRVFSVRTIDRVTTLTGSAKERVGKPRCITGPFSRGLVRQWPRSSTSGIRFLASAFKCRKHRARLDILVACRGRIPFDFRITVVDLVAFPVEPICRHGECRDYRY